LTLASRPGPASFGASNNAVLLILGVSKQSALDHSPRSVGLLPLPQPFLNPLQVKRLSCRSI
jgi:hypothetical protein